MITLIDKSQIRDYNSLTGQFFATGMRVYGDISNIGLISGISGQFDNLQVGNLTITGSLVNDMLSGLFNTNSSGSGIFHFLAIPNTSGLYSHYRASFSLSDPPTSPLQSFSSQDSQAEWQYFSNASWNAWPAPGLSPTQQEASIVRLMFKPTGFVTNVNHYAYAQPIFQGNITGSNTTSLQFRPNNNGFTLVAIPSLAEFFQTADSRYARKLQIGSNYILSGVEVSGLPLILQTFNSLPTTGYGEATLISVSGRIYNWHETTNFTGYQPISNITGLSFPSGGVVSAANTILSGQGQIIISKQSDNIIAISGGGVNTFAIAAHDFRQGSLILSGGAGMTLSSGLTSSGIVITFISTASGSSGGVGNVTGIGANSLQLFTGGFSVSGQNGITAYLSNLAPGTSGIIISGASQNPIGVTGFSNNLNNILFTGGLIISGQNGIVTYLTNLGSNISGVIVSGTNNITSIDIDDIYLTIWNQIGY